MLCTQRGSTLHFPKQDVVLIYLQRHVLTSPKACPILTTAKINEAIATVLAEKNQTLKAIDKQIQLLLDKVTGEPQNNLKTAKTLLITALKECALAYPQKKAHHANEYLTEEGSINA